MSFSNDLKRFSAKTEKKMTIAFKKIAFDISRAVILRTPVDTGRARANWLPAINRASEGVVGSTDQTGNSAIGRVQTEASKMSLGDSFVLVNNLPYIQELENGSSQQAPSGMLALSVVEFKPIVSRAIKAARS